MLKIKKEDMEHLGLSLTLCKKIIRDLNGWLTVESSPTISTKVKIFIQIYRNYNDGE